MRHHALIQTMFSILLAAPWALAQNHPVAIDSSSARGNSALASVKEEEETERLKANVAELASEVQRLTFELRQLQLETLRARIVPLEQELAQTGWRRQRLEAQESTLQQEIAQLDQALGEPSLLVEERQQLEVNKAELIENELERVRVEHTVATQREAEVSQQLLPAKQRWQQLYEMMQQSRHEAAENRRSRKQ